MTVKDYFSDHSGEYATYRPSYPEELADYLASLPGRRETVWEAGCGSGQLTRTLANRFGRVFATDASAEQLALAPRISNVEYRQTRAEESELADGTADLCVAAQAAHWFDLDAYYAEVRRVGRRGGAIALVTYGLMRVDERVDALVDGFYTSMQDGYWPPERRHVESGYAGLPFPFDEIDAPPIEMRAEWSLSELMGYIVTWSGTLAMIAAEGTAPIDALADRLATAWGAPAASRIVRWPLGMRVGLIR